MNPAAPRKLKKFFYRIEHKDSKIGPYRHDSKKELGYTYHTSVAEIITQTGDYHYKNGRRVDFYSNYHKAPYVDGLGAVVDSAPEGAMRFGFKSMRQLTKWWSDSEKVYRLMDECGFQVVRYQVTERFDSCRQSIAMIDDMKNPVVLPFPA